MKAIDLSHPLGDPLLRELLGHSVGFPTIEKLNRVLAQYGEPPYRLVGFEADNVLGGCLASKCWALELVSSATSP